MKESERIADQFARSFNGEPWIDVNVMNTLSSLTAVQAYKRSLPKANTIWEIVNHLIHWHNTVARRLRGENIPTPESNFFEPVTDHSDEAWQRTLKDFETSHKEWVDLLKNIDENWLHVPVPPWNQPRYELVMGILQHDAYHLGQIVLLKKFV